MNIMSGRCEQLKDFLYLAWKDLLMEFRTKQMLNSMVIFSLLVIVIFNYSFSNILFNIDVADIAPGILWIAFTFAGMLGLSRSFSSEMEEGCLDGLKLCPVDPSTIYLGKVVSNLVIMFLIEAIIVPLVPLLPGHNLLILYYIFEYKLCCNKKYQIVNDQQPDLVDCSKQVAG